MLVSITYLATCVAAYILPASIYVNECDTVVKRFVCRVSFAAPFTVRCVKGEYFVLFLKNPQIIIF